MVSCAAHFGRQLCCAVKNGMRDPPPLPLTSVFWLQYLLT